MKVTIRRHVTNYSCYVIPLICYSLPLYICAVIYQNCTAGLFPLLFLFLPFLFVLLFVFSAGIASIPFQKGIVAGKFHRDPGHKIYSKRKIYGTCWTTLFYCKPAYFLVLNSKLLKTIAFRLFGYRGNMNFIVYADSWIRDLCLLELGKGAYLSNRCTIGTNICHLYDTISVDKITIGEKSMVGHLAKIAHGCRIGNHSEIGVGCGIGINVSIGNHVVIGPMSMINHYARIGNHVRVGSKSYIGAGSIISDYIVIPAGALIPEKARINFQSDTDKYLSSSYLLKSPARLPLNYRESTVSISGVK